MSISVTRTGAEEATICREYRPEDDSAADPAAAAADVMEALSEVDARAEGVPSMEDLLNPPTPLAPPRILVLSPDPAAGVRGVENIFSEFTENFLSNYSQAPARFPYQHFTFTAKILFSVVLEVGFRQSQLV